MASAVMGLVSGPIVDRSGADVVLAGLAGLLLVLSVAQILLLPMHEKDWILAAPPEHPCAASTD